MSGTTQIQKQKILKIQKTFVLSPKALLMATPVLFLKQHGTSILPYDFLIKQSQLTFMRSIEHKRGSELFLNYLD
jgi:hypothetical protein